MHEVVLDDDDPVYINVKKMPTFADLLNRAVSRRKIVLKSHHAYLITKVTLRYDSLILEVEIRLMAPVA